MPAEAPRHACIRLPRLIVAACVSRIPPSRLSASMIALPERAAASHSPYQGRPLYGWQYIPCMHARYPRVCPAYCTLGTDTLARCMPSCLASIHAPSTPQTGKLECVADGALSSSALVSGSATGGSLGQMWSRSELAVFATLRGVRKLDTPGRGREASVDPGRRACFK